MTVVSTGKIGGLMIVAKEEKKRKRGRDLKSVKTSVLKSIPDITLINYFFSNSHLFA